MARGRRGGEGAPDRARPFAGGLRPFAERGVAAGAAAAQGGAMKMMRLSLCLAMAAIVWLGTLHVWFRDGAPVAAMARRQMDVWMGDRREVAVLRASNPEWDLMARMFAVLGLVNWALEAPERRQVLPVIDRIVDEAVAQAARHGQGHFLLPYGAGAFRDAAGRSLFVDGEIAMMLVARRLLVQQLGGELGGRDPGPWIARIAAQIERAPALLAESYPDETWVFCNAVALAAIRLHDVATGQAGAHAALLEAWVANARRAVVDHARERGPATGLMVSSTDAQGKVKQGPEGSSLWLAIDMLLVVDDGFAREQYRAARRQLIGRLAGFAWAREWPQAWPGYGDIDSGPTVPLVGANAGSSGLALVAAKALGDEELFRELSTSLEFAGFPMGGGRYAAGNLLADAVVFYARSHGPLWQLVRQRAAMGGAS